MKEKEIRCFDVWLAELPAPKGLHIQYGQCPVVVVSNEQANMLGPVITVIPMTSKTEIDRLQTHVLLAVDGMNDISLGLCEQILTIDKNRLRHRIGRVSEPLDQSALLRGMAVQFGIVA